MVLMIWLTALFAASILPVSGPATDLPADKVAHFIVYGITAVLFFRHFMARQSTYIFWLSVSAASIFGAAMEVVQAFVPYRQFSSGDMAANASGAFAFSVVYWLWRRQ